MQSILIFQTFFFKVFFLDSNYLYKLFSDIIKPFFRFFALYDRKIHFYPPYNRLLRITLKNRNIETLNIASDWFLNVLSQSFKGPILGPVFPPISRVRNYYHKQILIKLDSINSRLFFKKLLRRTKQSFDSIAKFKSTKLSIDVDPY